MEAPATVLVELAGNELTDFLSLVGPDDEISIASAHDPAVIEPDVKL